MTQPKPRCCMNHLILHNSNQPLIKDLACALLNFCLILFTSFFFSPRLLFARHIFVARLPVCYGMSDDSNNINKRERTLMMYLCLLMLLLFLFCFFVFHSTIAHNATATVTQTSSCCIIIIMNTWSA